MSTKIKIAVLVGRFPVVSEKFVVNHLVGLAQQGMDVTLISVISGDSNVDDTSIERFGLLDRHLFAGVPKNWLVRLMKTVFVFCDLLFRAPDIAVRALDYRRYRTAAINGKNIFLAKLLLGNHFDLLHCHFGQNGLAGSFLYDIGVCKRMIVSFHGKDINTYPKRFGKSVYDYMFERVDRVICNTRFTADKVCALGMDSERLHVLPVSLPTERYPYTPASCQDSSVTVLTVGRLVEKKGHRYVLAAIHKLVGDLPQLRYRIVGDGPLRAELEGMAKELCIDDRCTFVGVKTGEEVAQEYVNCDIFVLASITARNGDMEGQGLVLQEAQSIGRPVIATRHNGIPDGVLEDESGILVEEKSVPALAAAILSLARDAERRTSMGQVGAEFVRKRFDDNVVTEEVCRIYRSTAQ